MDTMIQDIIFYVLVLLIIIAFYLGILKGIRLLLRYGKRYRHNRLFNASEYLPTEEIHTLRQVFYLIVITMSFTIIIYSLISLSLRFFSNYFVFVDILISLIVCLIIKKETTLEKIVFLTLIPFASTTFAMLDFFMTDSSLKFIVDPSMYPVTFIFIILHLLGYAYVIRVFIGKFTHYTESNGLGISILLLIGIVFISFLVTPMTENVPLLDSLVMVSNAFTSNGYAVLGSSSLGKLNSVILVWGGYILSGVGTATLATALTARHFHKKFEDFDEKFDKLQKSIDEMNAEKKE